ncbi:transposable element tc3 transposase [Caerostris darwini]|uniref:Transposable element tc3 transposase n=1 Tax=Caerostris darwini TaxID=1538125 RepID=A0AAV4SAD6_9ARAC|nr:transposable element tc3 transposase [Caerostris darwini]
MRDSTGPITSSALKKMMKKFEATGSLASRQRSGRPSTAAAVATTAGVSYGSVWKALRITLKRYPYMLQHKQELLTSTLAEVLRIWYSIRRKSNTMGFTLCFGQMKRISRSLELL